MDLLADFFLGAGALAAAFYCLILSRKLTRLKGLDQDLGGAIAVLSKQVDEMTKALDTAQSVAAESSVTLESTTGRAENVADRLEVLLAALHDVAEETEPAGTSQTPKPSSALEETEAANSVFMRSSRRKVEEQVS